MSNVRFLSLSIALFFAVLSAAPAAHCQTVEEQVRQTGERWSRLEAKYKIEESALEFSPAPPETFGAASKVIPNGQTSFLAKLMMIRQAKFSVDIATYEFARDVAAYAVLHELKNALMRGVSVRILADSYASKHWLHPNLKALIAFQENQKRSNRAVGNLSIKLFNSLTDWQTKLKGAWATFRNFFTPPEWDIIVPKNWTNRRLHDKLLLVDGQSATGAMSMIGGRNINGVAHGIPNFDLKTYQDMDILVKAHGDSRLGPLTYAYFEALFYHIGNRKLGANFFGDDTMKFHFPNELKKIDDGLSEMFRHNPSLRDRLQAMENNRYLAENFQAGPTMLVHELQNVVARDWATGFVLKDPANQKSNGSALSKIFANHVRNAKKQVVVAAPYLYISKTEAHLIYTWLKNDRTRQLLLYTNSNFTIDNIFAQIMTDFGAIRKYLRSDSWVDVRDQVKIYQYGTLDDVRFGGKKMFGLMHSKFAVIDGETIIVTTSNSDPRSRLWNSEIGYFIKSPELANQLIQQTQVIRDGSYEWGEPNWIILRAVSPSIVPVIFQETVFTIMEATGFVQLM